MIHAFWIGEGRARYANRYVRTPRWLTEHAAGRALFGGLGLPSDPSVEKVLSGGANTHIVFHAGKLMAPKIIPKEVATIKEEELPPPTSGVAGVVGGVPGGVAGGAMGGVLQGIIGGVPPMAPPPPPPPKPVETAAAPTRIKIGGAVQQARLVRQPHPIYPPLAKQARISGVVRLSAIISKDGTIQKLEVISGHPLLVPAALEAVKQWVYQPPLLNGEPVEVITQIDVNFTLSQ